MGDIGTDTTAAGGAVPADERPWSRLDFEARYVVGEKIGAGGMGEVWAAHDRVVGRDVAIKRLRGDAPAAVRDTLTERFLREARVQGRLEHPAIVPVHDVGLDGGGRPFLVMKRIAGVTLQQVVEARRRGDAEARRRWPRRRLLSDLVTLLRALELAHRRGVIHRDVKPSNIMLGELGEVYLLDWGVARIAGDVADEIVGTTGYMAPEQEAGEPVDGRADVYSAGRVLRDIADDGDDAPPELAIACARALARDRDERTTDVAELADAIERYLDGDRDLEQRRRLAGEHAAAAREALGDGATPAQRAAAMHEAGRALAIDPSCEPAQALASRLLLEPPATTPPEVAAALDRDDQAILRRHARAATLAYVFYLCCVPLLFVVGVKTLLYPAAVTGILLVQIAHCAWMWRMAPRIRGGSVLVTFALDCVLIGLLALVAGAYFIAPALAMGVTVMYARNTAAARPAIVVPVALASFTVPLVLELVGVLPRIYHFTGEQIVVSSWVVDLDPAPFLIACYAFIVVNVVLVGMVAGRVREQTDDAERRLRVQAWQLAQLAPH